MTIHKRLRKSKFMQVKRLHISYQTYPHLDGLEIFLSTRKNGSGIVLRDLFEMLDIPESEGEKIFDDSRRRSEYDGGYTPRGKQRLANLLGKEIQFHKGYGAGLCYYDRCGLDIYIPQNR